MRTIALLLATASTLAAQPAPHTTTIPKVATGTFIPGASSFPLGRTGGKAQYWYRGDQLHLPSVITAIGPRPSSNFNGVARTQSLEITAANTSLAHSQFGTSFATNLGNQPTVLYARKNLAIPAVTAHSNFDAPGVWIMLDAPFPLVGPNLVLDFDLGSAIGAGSASYNGDLINLSGTGKHMTSDPGCGGTLAATSTAATYTLNLTGATPSAPTWLLLGLEATNAGGVPLPYKLDALGMSGCVLGVAPQLVLPGTASAAGGASVSVPIPSLPEAAVVYAQYAHTATTPAGMATTNVTRSILGINGFCSYIYNFTVDGPNAQNGPFNWQGVMLLQP